MGYKIKSIYLLFLLLLLPISGFATTYYVREDGTAANKAAATSCSTALTAMSIAKHNTETFSSDDVIIACNEGGDYVLTELKPPFSGISEHNIIYDLSNAVFRGNNSLNEAISTWGKSYITFFGGEFTGSYIWQVMAFMAPKYITVDGVYIHDVDKKGAIFSGYNETDADHVEFINSRCEDTTEYCCMMYIQGIGDASGEEEGTVHDFTVSNNYARNVKGLLLVWGSQANTYPNGDKTVEHSAYNFTIEDNDVDTTTSYCINIGGARSTGTNLIRRNKCINIGNDTVPNINAYQLNACDGCIVEDNECANVDTSVPDGVCFILDFAFADDDLLTEGAIIRYNYSHDNHAGSNQGNGLQFWKAKNCISHGNIYANNDIAIRAENDESTGNKSYNETIYNSAYADIYVGGYANGSGLEAKNIIASGNPTYHYYVGNGSTLISDYNLIYPATGTKFYCKGTTYNFTDYKAASSPLDGNEIVTNGDMELDSNWTSTGTPETNERSNVQAHGGTYSRHIVDSTASYGGIIQNGKTFELGEGYKFNFWYYLISGTLEWAIIYDDGTSFKASTTTATGSWKQISRSGVTTKSASNARIKFRNPSSSVAAEFYIDDVSLQKVILSNGQDAHSIIADPLFINPANGNFRLNNNSPAIDAGTYINIPDIGAYENYNVGD